ncbi:hypothetical protein P8A18_18405 [Streptomyces castrisilvae]|uniref:Secreted protein n=1 Tax=Streptomyces castrisilvae TaxID=3033811 RepID=A0ABY9HL42_9ACTN|nr:hypothetical protein [Streptomyces sp. Mut1]WLQ35271.1 hypothetical protein P8A18_18405 [Streptomyces sp. Mut1]
MNDDHTPEPAPAADHAPVTEPAPALVPDPAPEPEPAAVADAPAPVRGGRTRRVVLTAVPVVLVLAAVGGAAAYTKTTVDDADRTVTTQLWEEPAHEPGKDPAGDVARGRASTELSKLLLPVPPGYRLGPDSGTYGNDAEVSGRAAAAEMKEGGRGLSGRQRRDFEKRVDKLRVQGLAVRTYTSDDNDLVIATQLVRMKDRKALKDLYSFRAGLFDSIDALRDGPKIDGHKKNAKCFRDPKNSKQRIEGMFCMAYEGEVMVTFSASGTKPFDKAAVAELVKDQLNHITSPGEYI